MPVRIDAHHHVWDLTRRPQPWTDGLAPLSRSFPFHELAPQLAWCGVTATVVVQTAASLDETYELIELADRHQEIAGVVAWFDLEWPSLADDITAARSARGGHRLAAVRHQLQLEPDPAWLGRAAVRAGLRVLAEHDLAYNIVVSPEQLPLVIDTAAALPQVRLVLDHAGKPPIAAKRLDRWRADLQTLSTYDNVTCKLSGLVREADWSHWSSADLKPVATAVLDSFGPERTMFGSDWPVSLLAGASYETVVDTAHALLASLSDAERAAVWGHTAARTYRLDLP